MASVMPITMNEGLTSKIDFCLDKVDAGAKSCKLVKEDE